MLMYSRVEDGYVIVSIETWPQTLVESPFPNTDHNVSVYVSAVRLTFSLILIPPIMGCMSILKENIIDYHCHLNLPGCVLFKMNNNHAYLTPRKLCFLVETECSTHSKQNRKLVS